MASPDEVANRVRAAIGSAIFLVVAPGIVAGFLPWVVSRWRFGWPANAAPSDVVVGALGAIAITAGVAVLVEAFVRFAVEGLGTPAPVYPTERLIVTGTYRFVRNPMYLAVESIILGQAALLGSLDLVIYAAMIGVSLYLFVVLAEEPVLKRSFPAEYRRYAANVPRFVPRLTPWSR